MLLYSKRYTRLTLCYSQTMTSKQLLRRARLLFCNPLAPAAVNRHNQRQWVRSVRLLGDRWLLARQVERRA